MHRKHTHSFLLGGINISSLIQVSLEEVCREAGLPWTDRGSTNSDRGIVKSVTRKHEGLKDGLLELMSVCREARNIANPQGIIIHHAVITLFLGS